METVFSIEPSLDKTVVVNPTGWVNNLIIRYGVSVHAGVSYLCWKIDGIDHIFRIQAAIVYEKHGLNFTDHFILTLKVFREDYKSWESDGFLQDWMKRYEKLFNTFII